MRKTFFTLAAAAALAWMTSPVVAQEAQKDAPSTGQAGVNAPDTPTPPKANIDVDAGRSGTDVDATIKGQGPDKANLNGERPHRLDVDVDAKGEGGPRIDADGRRLGADVDVDKDRLEADVNRGADRNMNRDRDRGDRDNDRSARWRYKRHNGEWWYWHPDRYWLYWRAGNWNRYDRNAFETVWNFLRRTRAFDDNFNDYGWYRNRYYTEYGPPYDSRTGRGWYGTGYRGYDGYDDGFYRDRYGYYRRPYDGRFRDPDVRQRARIGADIGGAIGGGRGARIGADIGAGIGGAVDGDRDRDNRDRGEGGPNRSQGPQRDRNR